MKTPIEIEATFDDTNSLADMLKVIGFAKQMCAVRGKVTLLLQYQNCCPEKIAGFNKVLEFKHSLPQNIRFLKSMRPSMMKDKGFDEKENKFHDYFFEIKSLRDAEILKDWNIVCESVIFRINPDNVDGVLDGFRLLYNANQQVTNFANIKLDRDFLKFTSNMEDSLTKFFNELMPGHYFFNEKDENIYCNDETLPIKGIRSLKKQFLKYTYIQEYGSVIIGPSGEILNSVNHEPVSKETLLNFTASPDESTMTKVNIISREEGLCENCSLKGLCGRLGEITWYKEDIFQFSCDEAKYWNFVYELAKSICSTTVPPGSRII